GGEDVRVRRGFVETVRVADRRPQRRLRRRLSGEDEIHSKQMGRGRSVAKPSARFQKAHPIEAQRKSRLAIVRAGGSWPARFRCATPGGLLRGGNGSLPVRSRKV